MVAIGVHFTNCSPYATNQSSLSSESVINCSTSDCISKTVANLSLKINWGNTNEFHVTPDLAEFNLGGDCNEGGYPYNTVRWELHLNNAMVRHSGMIPANSRCVNGRFMIYVFLGTTAGDPVNRTGLRTQNGTKATYDLWVEIEGQDTPGGPPQRNALKGRTRMTLLAVQ
jgi:hypothetical protein